MLSVTATSLWFPSVNAYLVFKMSSQTPVARGPLTWQDMQLSKTHLCFSFLSRTHVKTQCCGSPPCGLTVDRHSSVNSGPGTREDFMTVPDVFAFAADEEQHRALVPECFLSVLQRERGQHRECPERNGYPVPGARTTLRSWWAPCSSSSSSWISRMSYSVQHLSTIAEWGYLEFLHHRVEARTKPCDAAKGRRATCGVFRRRAVLHYRGDVRCPRVSLSLSGDVALESDGTDNRHHQWRDFLLPAR